MAVKQWPVAGARSHCHHQTSLRVTQKSHRKVSGLWMTPETKRVGIILSISVSYQMVHDGEIRAEFPRFH